MRILHTFLHLVLLFICCFTVFAQSSYVGTMSVDDKNSLKYKATEVLFQKKTDFFNINDTNISEQIRVDFNNGRISEKCFSILLNALAEINKKELFLAEEHLQDALLLNPDYHNIYMLLSVVNYDLGNYELVLSYCNNFIDLKGFNPTIYLIKAYAYFSLKDNSGCLQFLKKYIQYVPNDAIVLLNIAILEIIERNPKRALFYAQKAKRSSPDNHQVFKVIADSYFRLKNYDQARENYLIAISKNPKDITSLINIAGVFYEQNDNQQSLIYLNKALDIDPSNHTIFYNIANIYKRQKDYDFAFRNFKKALNLNPDDILTIINLGFCSLSLSNPSEAVTYFNKAIEINPGMTESYEGLGFAYLKLNDYIKAKNNFQKAQYLYMLSKDITKSQEMGYFIDLIK
ncbi:MAG: tetratricopeptide repeat protein [Candidatus Omnitrophica bacterium]|nr:tetratricopeptide repeat protein [Candidatus Omnitrophota bacterium]